MSTEMLRHNSGKPRLSLLPTAFMQVLDDARYIPLQEETARVLEFGATKYAMNNWRKAGPWMKPLDSGLRHLYKLMYTNETHDPESGIHHAGHLGCNLAFLLEFIREGDGEDDRYSTKTKIADAKYAPVNELRAVFKLLLNWRDGGDYTHLKEATQSLALWFNTATPATTATIPSVFVPIDHLLKGTEKKD